MDPELMEGIKHQEAFELVMRSIASIRIATEQIKDGSSLTDVTNPIISSAMQTILDDLLAFESEWWYRL